MNTTLCIIAVILILIAIAVFGGAAGWFYLLVLAGIVLWTVVIEPFADRFDEKREQAKKHKDSKLKTT